MITKVRVKHFRSIEDAEFTLAPLTVLVGPNASGKSNLLDIFRFLGDTAREGLDSAIRTRGGIGAIGWRAPNGSIQAPKFWFEFFLMNVRAVYSFAIKALNRWEYEVTDEKASVHWVGDNIQDSELTIENGQLTASALQSLMDYIEIVHGEQNPDQLAKDRIAVEQAARTIEGLPATTLRLLPLQSQSAIPYLMNVLHRLDASLQNSILHLIHVMMDAHATSRKIELYHIFPNSLRSPQLMANSQPLNSDAGNLASTLQDMLNRRDPFAEEIKACLAAAVSGLRDIRVIPAGSHFVVELGHERPGEDHEFTWFDLYHEADGTIRMLALLTALYQQPSPSLICLEEPEVGIHPGALTVISDVLQEATLRGQVIVTTHSPELIGQVPVESIRAVSAESGSTKVGPVTENQLKSVREGLFSAGEIHHMEGLYPTQAIGQGEC